MAEIKISCPHCGQRIECDSSYSGQQVACPSCQQALVVPQLATIAQPVTIAAPLQVQHREQPEPVANIPFARPTRRPTGKQKPRAKWWIVSTHVVTAMIAFPIVFWIVVVLVVQLLGLQLSNTMVTTIGVAFVGFLALLCGTAYSLNYVSQNVFTDNWAGCIAPSVMAGAVITLASIVVTAVYMPQSIAANTINSLAQMVAFSVMTTNRFRELQK